MAICQLAPCCIAHLAEVARHKSLHHGAKSGIMHTRRLRAHTHACRLRHETTAHTSWLGHHAISRLLRHEPTRSTTWESSHLRLHPLSAECSAALRTSEGALSWWCIEERVAPALWLAGGLHAHPAHAAHTTHSHASWHASLHWTLLLSTAGIACSLSIHEAWSSTAHALLLRLLTKALLLHAWVEPVRLLLPLVWLHDAQRS